MKIAPVLTALLADLRTTDKHRKPLPGDVQVLRIAESELKALLAVARAADYEAGVGVDEHHSRPDCKLCRALARLERVSRVKP